MYIRWLLYTIYDTLSIMAIWFKIFLWELNFLIHDYHFKTYTHNVDIKAATAIVAVNVKVI